MSASTSASSSSSSSIFDMNRLDYVSYEKVYNDIMNKKYNSDKFDKPGSTISRKQTMTMARKIAFNTLKHTFDINKSFRENKGDTKKLEKDIEHMYWSMFREQFPTHDDYIESSIHDKYVDTPYDKYRQHSSYRSNLKKAEEKENKERGQQKRILREQKYRNNIGDEEFNRRMLIDKKKKAEKGGTDKQYLAYLEWKNTFEGKQYNEGFGQQSNGIVHVDSQTFLQKLNGILASNIKSLMVPKQVFYDILIEILENHKEYRINMSLREGSTANQIPTQHVIFEPHSIRDIVSAQRKTVIEGTVLKWYRSHKGMYVCFDSYPGSYHRTYPKQWENFENFKDPETGEFVGNPKIKSLAHKFYKVCGKELEMSLFYNKHKYTIIYPGHDNVYDTKEKLLKMMTENNTENKIKNRLQDKIKKEKEERANKYKARGAWPGPSDTRLKYLEKKEKERQEQFNKISDLFMEGTINKAQFEEMMKKYNL